MLAGIAANISQQVLRTDVAGMPLEWIDYREAVRLEPDFAFAHNNLANRLREGGRLDAAIDHYRQALHVAPGFAMAHDNLGAALAMRGDLGEAIVHFREACRIDPGNAGALVHLASALEARDAP